MRPSRLTAVARIGDALRRSRSSLKMKTVEGISHVAIDSSQIPGARSSQGTCHFSSTNPWTYSLLRDKREQSQNRATSLLFERSRRFALTPPVETRRLHCFNSLETVGQIDPQAGENRLVSMWRVRGLRERIVIPSRGPQPCLDAVSWLVGPRAASG